MFLSTYTEERKCFARCFGKPEKSQLKCLSIVALRYARGSNPWVPNCFPKVPSAWIMSSVERLSYSVSFTVCGASGFAPWCPTSHSFSWPHILRCSSCHRRSPMRVRAASSALPAAKLKARFAPCRLCEVSAAARWIIVAIPTQHCSLLWYSCRPQSSFCSSFHPAWPPSAPSSAFSTGWHISLTRGAAPLRAWKLETKVA